MSRLEPDPSLIADLARADPDRWLAARLGPPETRARLTALYAVNLELARVGETTTEALIGAMRLAWWRETVQAIGAGEPPRAHPAALALAAALDDLGDEREAVAEALLALIDARERDIDPEPFASPQAVCAYAEATAGAVMGLAGRLSVTPQLTAAQAQALALGGRAWGLAGLARSVGPLAARGWRPWPAAWLDARARDQLAHRDSETARRVACELAAASERAWRDARPALRALPADFAPVIGYLALLPAYGRAVRAPTYNPFAAP
ncbi:MAG: squalene/phytoene synthase family protein, partial [Maricaulaceae bacterium]